ncbi:MAG: arsenite methyltransferase [Acidobacteria bacterium]|nr:arsenite methyltransferase [Acidobacteriota bacterium]
MSSQIEQVVRERYGSVAKSGLSSEQGGVRAVAEAFGYTAEELASIPAEANMGLSCGNPTATASLREGEVVVDLGSGGGLDVFLAAEKVGPQGRAIGIDMTPEMLELARRNAAKRLEGGAPDNVEFHLATIDRLPLADSSVDCVISNCVINLAPDKRAVFREIARVLKPGGRLAVSDIALKRALPPEVSGDVAAYVGCIAGAIPVEEYRRGLAEAGFAEVAVIDSGADLNAYSQVEGQSGCCSPAMNEDAAAPEESAPKSLPVAAASCCAPAGTSTTAAVSCCAPAASAGGEQQGDLGELLARYDVNDYAASVKVFAVKPRGE